MPDPVESAGAIMAPMEYESIERAVMESKRGRWFLEEYARRLRRNETATVLQAIGKLETALNASQDALTERIAKTLGVIIPAVTPNEPSTMTSAQMKYFRQDEEIFEPNPAKLKPVPPTSSEPETRRGAKLIIRRLGETATQATDQPSAPEPAPATIPEPVMESAPFASMPDESSKQRIIIIRHKPGEHVDVPLQEDQAASA